ncbi:MAG: hypothetical protein AAF552_13205 [Pseudomonadota bacterium]
MKRNYLCLIAALCMLSSVSGAPLETAFTYQGQLNQLSRPANGTFDFEVALFDVAENGSTLAPAVVVEDVMVVDGIFSIELDFGLTGISDEQLWLEVSVRDGRQIALFTPLTPRTKLAPSPASLYALSAGVAETLAIGNLITVATVGGDFSSVAAALNSISDASPENPYLVQVGPGEFTETDLVEVPGNVHLRGSGIQATTIVSERTASQNNPDAATLQLLDAAQASNLTVRNRGASAISLGVFMSNDATLSTILEDVNVILDDSGGLGHTAIYLLDASPTTRNVRAQASGATTVNAGLASINSTAGFPRALIRNSVFLGAEVSELSCSDNSGTGIGMFLSESSPEVYDSIICGDHRGVQLSINGNPRFQRSQIAVSTASNAFLLESSGGSIGIANSQLRFFDNSSKLTGSGGSLICLDNYDINFRSLVDGFGTGTACNQ